jgi:hypothetical protein
MIHHIMLVHAGYRRSITSIIARTTFISAARCLPVITAIACMLSALGLMMTQEPIRVGETASIRRIVNYAANPRAQFGATVAPDHQLFDTSRVAQIRHQPDTSRELSSESKGGQPISTSRRRWGGGSDNSGSKDEPGSIAAMRDAGTCNISAPSRLSPGEL